MPTRLYGPTRQLGPLESLITIPNCMHARLYFSRSGFTEVRTLGGHFENIFDLTTDVQLKPEKRASIRSLISGFKDI